MAEIVMAYSASHAPMMTADRESAPRAQADNFFGALRTLRERAIETGVEAIVMVSGEHFSNFFFDTNSGWSQPAHTKVPARFS